MDKQNFKFAIDEMLNEIAERIPDGHKSYPVEAFIAGGIAVFLLTEARGSDDIDLILSNRIDLPQNLFVVWLDGDEYKEIYFDTGYNDTLGTMHEDYPSRAFDFKTIDEKFIVKVLHPVDVIISKIGRAGDKDLSDIKLILEKHDIDRDMLVKLAKDAIEIAIGVRKEELYIHLDWVLEIFDEVESYK